MDRYRVRDAFVLGMIFASGAGMIGGIVYMIVGYTEQCG